MGTEIESLGVNPHLNMILAAISVQGLIITRYLMINISICVDSFIFIQIDEQTIIRRWYVIVRFIAFLLLIAEFFT